MLEWHACDRKRLEPQKPPATSLQQGTTQQTRLCVNVRQPIGTGIALNPFDKCRAMALA